MGLSSNTIIHFTNTKEKLTGILTNNFKINYCKEDIILDNSSFTFFVPMVSFCDIPLSEVKNHINKYGAYGIGLTKEWAERNRLNPVFYIEKNSDLSTSYLRTYTEYVVPKKLVQELSDNEKCIVDILRYIKNYQNDLIRGGDIIKDYRFSDEREWRYVPNFNHECIMMLAAEDYNTKEKKEVYNKGLKDLALTFEPNDIKYIIIETDTEISEFVELLRNAKGKTYTYHDIERLMTRILTTEQIVSDI